MKKALAISVLLLSALCLFAGGGKEEASSDGVVTIKYAFWGNPDAIGVEQDIIDAFEESHPNIHVEPVVSAYNDYHTKIMTMIAGGMAPDVMRLDCYFFQDFYDLGAVINLDPYIEKTGFDVNIHPKAAIEEATKDGHVVALPWSAAPYYFAFNLDTFEKAGIPIPDYDWTIDDFIAICEAFGGDETGVYGFATSMAAQNPFYAFIWGFGSDLLNEDKTHYAMNDEGAVAALEIIADLYQRGLLPRDMISTATAEPVTRWFTNGTVAMMTVSAQEILAIQNVEGVRFEVYPAPGGRVEKNTTTIKSNEISISASSKHKDEAWEFLSFLRGNEGERLYAAARRIPPSLNNDDTLWDLYLDSTKYPFKIKEVTDLINSTYGHQLPLRAGYSEIDANTVPIFQKIMTGAVTAQQGLDELGVKVEEIIARTN